MVVLFLFVWWARHDHTGADGRFLWLARGLAFAGRRGGVLVRAAMLTPRRPTTGRWPLGLAPPLFSVQRAAVARAVRRDRAGT